ncbi:hypothetical protein AAH979_33480 [Plantactinospora sp. ZYX-F-223]|uniref:hypothetical protein n=1 Tax=Plantactinospora sp. ZYX-F-223 TaxID=3144103 RepID=UPI0031FD28DE
MDQCAEQTSMRQVGPGLNILVDLGGMPWRWCCRASRGSLLVPGACLTDDLWSKWSLPLTDEPRFLTAGRQDPEDPESLIVTRASLAASFAIGVDSPSQRYDVLWGAYSIVVVGLDRGDHARSRVWFDLWTELDVAEEHLHARIAEVNPPS